MYGEVTTSAYDNATHTTRIANSLGTTTQKTDAYGNLVYVKDANTIGRETTYKYDKLDRNIESTDYRGRVITNTYDDFNNLTRTQDTGTLNQIDYQYDALNRRTKTSDTLGQISRISYDQVGNKVSEQLTVNDGAIRETTYKYDELNRQLSMTRAIDGASTKMVYDGVGNVVSVTDALGRVTATTYDQLNRQTSVTKAFGTPDATTSTYTYDKAGNLLSSADGNSNVATDHYSTRYTYDALNRRTNVIDPYDDTTHTDYFYTPDQVTTALAELGSGIALPVGTVGKVVKTTDALGHADYVLYDRW